MLISLQKELKIVFIISILILGCNFFSAAQVVWENPKHEVIKFLNRQAQKGNITLTDYIQPISRKEISELLYQLQSKNLSTIEKKELNFYQQEFTEFDPQLKNSLTILKKDQYNRFRMLSVKQEDFLLKADPILTIETTQGSTQNLLKISNGLSIFAHIGSHITVQSSFRDVTETGDGLDSFKRFSPEIGVVRAENVDYTKTSKKLNYVDVTGYVTYSWHNGNVSIGKDQNLFGFGENGRIILSDKAPSYPFIRVDYQPLKWLRFNYSHAWLQSGLIDSNSTYPKGNSLYGSNRDIYIPKYLVTHSLSFLPTKGLLFSFGESMLYSDNFDAAYLIPLLFFKAYDQYKSRNNINAGSNGQFFFQASSRNHIKNTHFYTSLFIDEIRTTTIFNPARSRNQLGFSFGSNITDVFVPYLTLGVEYTRINPFVYKNIIPAQTYENQNYSLGDWMGNNADRFIAFIKYTPLPKLKTSLTYQKVRKGSEGTLDQQYFAEPQPQFLFDLQRDQTAFIFNTSYEWINNLYLAARVSAFTDNNFINNTQTKNTQFQFSISYGL